MSAPRMIRGINAGRTSGSTSTGQNQGYFSGPTSELGLVSISICSLQILVSLFNNAENTNISGGQINNQIHVHGHTGL